MMELLTRLNDQVPPIRSQAPPIRTSLEDVPIDLTITTGSRLSHPVSLQATDISPFMKEMQRSVIRREGLPLDMAEDRKGNFMVPLELTTDRKGNFMVPLEIGDRKGNYMVHPKKRHYVSDDTDSVLISHQNQHKKARLESLVDKVKAESVDISYSKAQSSAKVDFSSPFGEYKEHSISSSEENLNKENTQHNETFSALMNNFRKESNNVTSADKLRLFHNGFSEPSLLEDQLNIYKMLHMIHPNSPYVDPSMIQRQSFFNVLQDQQNLMYNAFLQEYFTRQFIESQNTRAENQLKSILEAQKRETEESSKLEKQLQSWQKSQENAFLQSRRPLQAPLISPHYKNLPDLGSVHPKEHFCKGTSPESSKNFTPLLSNSSTLRDFKEKHPHAAKERSTSPAPHCAASPLTASPPGSSSRHLTVSSPGSSTPRLPSTGLLKMSPPSGLPSSALISEEDRRALRSPSLPLEFDENGATRKRAPRALTGKHVRPGTGASPSTLITLRQKLANRQMSCQKSVIQRLSPAKTGKNKQKKR